MNAIILNFPIKKIDPPNLFNIYDIEIIKETLQKYLKLKDKVYDFSTHLQNAKRGLFDISFTNQGTITKENLKKMLSFYNSPSIDNWHKIKEIPLFYHFTANDIWEKFKIGEQELPSVELFMEGFRKMPKYIIEIYFEQLQIYNNTINFIELENPGIVDFILEKKGNHNEST